MDRTNVLAVPEYRPASCTRYRPPMLNYLCTYDNSHKVVTGFHTTMYVWTLIILITLDQVVGLLLFVSKVNLPAYIHRNV